MDRILDALRQTVTPGAFARLLAVSALLIGAAACSNSTPGGGGGGVLCALDGTCPAGMTCGGQYCFATSQDVAVSPDAATDAGATATDTGPAPQDAHASPQDTFVASQDTAVTPEDTVVTPEDTGSGGQDTQTTPDTTGAPSGSIASAQQAAASKICAKTDGELSITKGLTLTGVVATSDAEPLGKLMVFYARPPNAPADDGRWQGMKVVVFKGKSTVKAGDILTLTGDLVEYYCETEIKVDMDQIKVTGKANLAPAPFDVVVAEIASKGLQSESYEGVYVRLNNVEVAQANLLGTDGKTHGQFGVVTVGGTVPMVAIGGTAGTTFTSKDPKTGAIVTNMTKGKVFKSITGHLTYAFETYVLRPSADSDLVAQ